ncbi:2OG-Fe(II) oxygenase [Lysinibacillus xylanilyticus]|uniref:2OG-Fe(II) oxygenase n=1 Tax=Lysinibacillus xylanilyticus TaxID=582475 RepID=UPI003D0482C2
MHKNNYLDFTKTKFVNNPYKYIVVQNVFNPKFATLLLEWFQKTNNFNKFNESGYKNSIFHISKNTLPSNIEELINLENLKFLKGELEFAFKVKFTDDILISAQKYLPGDGTLIHNDYYENSDDAFHFTHRFFVYLNSEWIKDNGGILGIFKENNVNSLVEEVYPYHNWGVGIEFEKNSWHAVSAIKKGERFAIHFDFKKKEGE